MYNLRPSKSQQPEALLEAHGNMVKHPGGKFRALEAGAPIQRVVDDKNCGAIKEIRIFMANRKN